HAGHVLCGRRHFQYLRRQCGPSPMADDPCTRELRTSSVPVSQARRAMAVCIDTTAGPSRDGLFGRVSPRLAGPVWHIANVGIAIYGLLAPDLDEKLAITIWLPVVGALCLLTAWPTACSASARDRSRAIGQLLRQEVLPFAIGAALSTFAWLVPLVIALGPG